MKRIWITLLFAFGMLTLTACASQPIVDTSPTEPQPNTVAEPPFTLDQLVATDPATVQLAAGKVQLIEFYAYW